MTWPRVDATHDPGLRCWVAGADAEGCEFPVQNLPFGMFRLVGDEEARPGVAIGECVLLLDRVERFADVNAVMRLSAADRRTLRQKISRWLTDAANACELPRREAVRMHLPVRVGGYTDFYASREHARRVGGLLRSEEPLLPNYRWVPIGYHGRTSSLVVGGTAVRRPWGQALAAGPAGLGKAGPVFAPTARLDYETELGCYVAGADEGPLTVERAEERLFGLSLLNDWSARDVQAWEYRPLGPFLSKSFATTLGPWVVTAEALAPFRVPVAARGEGEPAPLAYLTGETRAFAVETEAWLRPGGREPVRLGGASAAGLFWSFAQMLTHHASNGCPLVPGDLLGSGTISGVEAGSEGCLMEMTRNGTEAVERGGVRRTWLEDGDEVLLRGRCRAEGFREIGFGPCRGTVVPAVAAWGSSGR